MAAAEARHPTVSPAVPPSREVAEPDRLVHPHPAAPVHRRLRLRPGDAAPHPAVPAGAASCWTAAAVRRSRRPRRICRPTAPAPRGARALTGRRWRRCVRTPAARTDPPSCRPGRPPSRNAGPTARRTAPTSRHARRGDLLEQRVDLRGRRDAERQRQSGWSDEVGGAQPGCMPGDGLLGVERAACCRRAARPRRAAPSGSGTARPSSR